MKPLTEEQKAELRRLGEAAAQAHVAAQEAQALFSQAVTAHAYLCGIPPSKDILLDPRTFEWSRVVVGRSGPDGAPILEPLLKE